MADIVEPRTKTIDVTVGKQCDVCRTESRDLHGIEGTWLRIGAGHDAWGNDSVDSWEWYDVCSPACYVKQLEECIADVACYSDRGGQISHHMPVAFAEKLQQAMIVRV